MNSKELLVQLEPEKQAIDAAMRNDLAVIVSPLLARVIEHGIFNGGKRVRPLLTLLAGHLCRGEDQAVQAEAADDPLYQLAIVFEYLHATSLLHDDVIDHADLRRGKKTANALWGNTPVILAGDYLHSRAMLLAGTLGGPETLGIVADATAAMVEAEFLQIQNAENRNPSEADYFAVLQGKTAALIAAACETGAVYANGSGHQRQALRTYGTNLGLAFQIIDDLLDYLGDPGKTGKIVGNDLMEGKITLPLIHALGRSDNADRSTLRELLAGTREARAQEVTTVARLIERHGGFLSARQAAEQLIRTGLAALDIFPQNRERHILTGLAGYVLSRNK